MHVMTRLVRAATLALILGVALALPRAYADPPERAGRVSVVEGGLTVVGQGGASAESAPVNYPVAEGMRFITDAGTHAALELGTATLSLDSRTTLDVATLDESAAVFRLQNGSVNVRVRILFDGERISVATADGEIVLTAPGTYRIDAAGAPPAAPATHVANFAGSVQIKSRHGDDDLFAGESVDIDGRTGALRYAKADSTWLDTWADAHTQEYANAASDEYVSPDMAGTEDLAGAGTWEQTDDYGAVWYPNTVPADWAPYRYGTWDWVDPWGWTWIDDQSWGFATSHYGRWVKTGHRWGWWPGVRQRHHVYTPGVVTFIGGGDTRHKRPQGWVPLAPGETYRPPFAHSDKYGRNANLGNDPRQGGARGWFHRDRDGRNDGHIDAHNDGHGVNDGRGVAGNGAHTPPPAAGLANGADMTTVTRQLPDSVRTPWNVRHGGQPNGGGPIVITDDTVGARRTPGAPRPGAFGGVPTTPSQTPAPPQPMTTSPAGPPPTLNGAPGFGRGPVQPQIQTPSVTPPTPVTPPPVVTPPAASPVPMQSEAWMRFQQHRAPNMPTQPAAVAGTPQPRRPETSAFGGRLQMPPAAGGLGVPSAPAHPFVPPSVAAPHFPPPTPVAPPHGVASAPAAPAPAQPQYTNRGGNPFGGAPGNPAGR
jgi:hypothetical protein